MIITNTNTAFITVDDKTIPYESKEIDGIKVPNFQANKPKADNGEILFPITILADYVGMKPTDEGFVIEKEEEKPADDQGNTNTGGSSNNSGSTNTSSGSSNNSSGSSSDSSSNNGGSSNSGSGSSNSGVNGINKYINY